MPILPNLKQKFSNNPRKEIDRQIDRLREEGEKIDNR